MCVKKLLKMTKKENFDIGISLSRMSMDLVGVWPFNNDKLADLKYMIALVAILIMLTTATADLFFNKTRVEFFDGFVNSLTIVYTMDKILLVKLKQDSIKVIFSKIQKNYEKYQYCTDKKKKIIAYYVKKGKKFSYICIVFAGSIIVIHLTSRIFYSLQPPRESRTWNLPYPATYPFDVSTSSPIVFLAVYAWQAFTILVFGCIALAVDCLVITTASHATGQLAGLCEDIRAYDDDEVHTDCPWQECLCIGCIVDRHVDLLGYCRLVEDSYHLILLNEFIGTTLQFCIQIYVIVMYSTHRNIIGSLTFIMYLIIFNFRFFMYCNVFDALIEMEENIKISAFNINWYEFRPKSIKSILLCILQANKPVNITAGKFLNLNRSSYKNVIMTSASYASVLLSLK